MATMKSEEHIRNRIAELERAYDKQDPPSSPQEEETEIELLRAIDELEWVLEEYENAAELTARVGSSARAGLERR